jgi:hypothetical protein
VLQSVWSEAVEALTEGIFSVLSGCTRNDDFVHRVARSEPGGSHRHGLRVLIEKVEGISVRVVAFPDSMDRLLPDDGLYIRAGSEGGGNRA